MGKFGWDLPPGCSTRDLPGNRPEDEAAEALAEKLYGILAEAGMDTDDPLVDKAVELLSKEWGEAYSRGYGDGVADESMARDAQHGDPSAQ